MCITTVQSMQATIVYPGGLVLSLSEINETYHLERWTLTPDCNRIAYGTVNEAIKNMLDYYMSKNCTILIRNDNT